jgi:two-component system OmpR family sensor kinase/two-component system sensor histidine kinase BaeS
MNGLKSLPEKGRHSAFRIPHSAFKRRPQLFTLMLASFALVIVLGVGGMVILYGLALGVQNTKPYPVMESVPTVVPPIAAKLGDPQANLESLGRPVTDSVPTSDGDVARGVISAGLALAAVLLGAAAVFSRRISKPIARLTMAARTMAEGDLSVRVSGFGVREINELAEAFNSMAGSIAYADSRRRQLTADVAHELRTPLSILKGRLEGMQDGVYAPTPDQIGLLLNETALLERLIEDLRLLAQADAGQLPLYAEQVCPQGLLQSVAGAFAPQARDAGVSLQLAPVCDLPDLYADPQRISQVLGNLISNALRHTPSGGTITLAAWTVPADSSHVYMSVQDTGMGIAPEDLPHVFDRFWKADRARSRSGGAGLGLAIARRIVEAHGGRIWAASAPGQGTTVAFALPAIVAAPIASPTSAPVTRPFTSARNLH